MTINLHGVLKTTNYLMSKIVSKDTKAEFSSILRAIELRNTVYKI